MKQLKDVAKLATVALLLAMAAGNSLSAQTPAGASSPAPATAQPDQAAGAVKAHDDSYTIGADDVLAINVWKEPDLTRSVPVRSDGKNFVTSDRGTAGRGNHTQAAGTGHRQETYQLRVGTRSDCYRAGDQEQKVQCARNGCASWFVPDHAHDDRARRDRVIRGISRFCETKVDLCLAHEARWNAGATAFQLQRCCEG